MTARDSRPHRVIRPGGTKKPIGNQRERPGDSPGLIRLHGRQPILEALRLGLVKSVEVIQGAHGRSMEEIVQRCNEQHVPLRRVDTMEDASGLTTQGVRALVMPPRTRLDLQQFIDDLKSPPAPLLVMLDGITDPHNFGAILRSAAAAAATGVIIRSHRQAPITDVVLKASAGAAFLIPIFEVSNLARTLRELGHAGYWSVAATVSRGSKDYREYHWETKTVLILGAEGAGISELLRREADDRIMIPMYGRADSLNVSVAAGILLFEAAQRRGLSQA